MYLLWISLVVSKRSKQWSCSGLGDSKLHSNRRSIDSQTGIHSFLFNNPLHNLFRSLGINLQINLQNINPSISLALLFPLLLSLLLPLLFPLFLPVTRFLILIILFLNNRRSFHLFQIRSFKYFRCCSCLL